MENRIDGDFRIECETRGLNPNTATLYDLLVKVRDAAHLELKQISDTALSFPPGVSAEYCNGYRSGYNEAHSSFARLCREYNLTASAVTISDLVAAVKTRTASEFGKITRDSEDERRYQHGDEAYKKGVEDGKAEAKIEQEYRKGTRAPIEAPGLTVHHVGDLKLTVVLGGLSTPDKN